MDHLDRSIADAHENKESLGGENSLVIEKKNIPLNDCELLVGYSFYVLYS